MCFVGGLCSIISPLSVCFIVKCYRFFNSIVYFIPPFYSIFFERSFHLSSSWKLWPQFAVRFFFLLYKGRSCFAYAIELPADVDETHIVTLASDKFRRRARIYLVGSFLFKLNQSHEFDCTQAAHKRKFKSTANTSEYEGVRTETCSRSR